MDITRSTYIVFIERAISVILALSVLSCLLPSLKGVGFIALMALPVLWLLWIGCALRPATYKSVYELARIWVAVDLVSLLLLLTSSLSFGDINASQGTDLVLGFMYFPVVFPTGFVFALLPEMNPLSLIDHFMRGPLLSAFGVWLQASLIAFIQSVAIYYLGRLLSNRSRRAHVKHVPA